MSFALRTLTFVFALPLGVVFGQPPTTASAPPRPIKLSLSSLVEIRLVVEDQIDRVVLIGQSPFTGGPVVDSNGNRVSTRQETRTRLVTVNGKQVQQTYTVNVPVFSKSETLSNQKMSGKSNPPPRPVQLTSRREIDLDNLQAWTIDGQAVKQTDLREFLTRPLAAFALRRPLVKGTTVDPTQAMVLRDDVLLIYASATP